MSITITNLTLEQKEMLDFMWNELDTEEDYLTWFGSLSSDQQLMADTLMRMIIMECSEEELGDLTEAKELLSKFTRK
jgi:late competence protein required for DNA uptake (superfamily II DNA/RNA helicase)